MIIILKHNHVLYNELLQMNMPLPPFYKEANLRHKVLGGTAAIWSTICQKFTRNLQGWVQMTVPWESICPAIKPTKQGRFYIVDGKRK